MTPQNLHFRTSLNSLAELLAKGATESDRNTHLLFQKILFGVLDLKKPTAKDRDSRLLERESQTGRDCQPACLPRLKANPDASLKRVAHSETSTLINQALFERHPADEEAATDERFMGVDAFTGEVVVLQDKFPVGPKVAELGNLKLFSVNTNEVQALQRYRLEGTRAFPVSAALVQKMSDALLYRLASEQKRGSTCRAIPSAQPGKRDLLLAYLEDESEGRTQLAEMFGGEAAIFSEADFAATAQPVVEMLKGKVAANPNLNVRLLSFCPIHNARKQISLNRQFRVVDVIRAAKDWQAGARNVPEVSVWFYDKTSRKSDFRTLTIPCPPSNLLRPSIAFGAPDARAGFVSGFQRAVFCLRCL